MNIQLRRWSASIGAAVATASAVGRTRRFSPASISSSAGRLLRPELVAVGTGGPHPCAALLQ